MELFEKANELHLQGRFAEAEKIYDDLLTQNHDNPGLLGTLGTLYLQMDKVGLAISLLERAAAQTPQGDIFCNLGIAYKQSGQYKKCKEWFAKAIKHNPTADVLANYSGLFINVGTPDDAIRHAQRAIKLDANCTMAHWNLAIASLEKGDFGTGWDEYEWGFRSQMRIDRGAKLAPVWDGKAPGTVWVYGEQGLGDEIMFASMIPDVLKTNKVVFECHPRLQTLFANSFDVPCIGTREEREITWFDQHPVDYSISAGSLGQFYRRTRADFPGAPYLKAESAPKGERFRVGISWSGGRKPGRVAVREVPLPWWKSILNNDCEFVSLQYTDCDDELEVMESLGYDIQKPREAKANDYYETAKLVQSCDLVISVCTSVVHLAGALGVPCWVLTPNKPAWRYGVSGGMPWYRSVRLYRQPPGDSDAWRPVISHVGADLDALINTRQRRTA